MFSMRHLSAEELIEKGIAPIKREHWTEGPPSLLLATSDAPSAADPAPGKKSRRQEKRDRQNSRTDSLCCNFVLGRCAFGERCKFSHDVASYVAKRRPDLPGSCPYTEQLECPFGITCRWALSHKGDDPFIEQHLRATYSATPEAPRQTGHTAVKAHASQQSLGGPSAQGEQQTGALQSAAQQEKAPSSAATEFDRASGGEGAPAGTPPVTSALDCERIANTASASTVNGGGAGENAIGPVRKTSGDALGDGSLPSGTVELPVLERCGPSVNVLDKEVQQRLRKNTHDFSKADAALAAIGAKVVVKGRQAGQHAAKRQKIAGKPVAAEGTSDVAPVAGVSTPGRAQEKAADDKSTSSRAKGASLTTEQFSTSGTGGATEGVKEQLLPVEMADVSGDGACLPSVKPSDQPGSQPGDAVNSSAVMQGIENGSLQENGRKRIFDVRSGPAQSKDWAGMHVDVPLKLEEKRKLDLRGKLYLAPLTTVGNLPFRRVCKMLGADVTCGEMALATNLLQGQASEWALLKRHPCEDLFGVQVCGGYPDTMTRCAQLLEESVDVDFVDCNMGCPIDLICSKGAGSAILLKPQRMEQVVRGMSSLLSVPLTIKVRRGYHDNADVAHTLLPQAASWGAAAATLHGRSRQQRYTRLADWDYIGRCVEAATPLPLIGNGDIFSYTDYLEHMEACPQLTTVMIARGALTKPWLFTEIKERRHWDISASERLDLLKTFCSAGLLHWGSDERGVETTRRFLLEWLSFLCRYVPVALLEVLPQRMTWRPPFFSGRSDLETLLASQKPADWVALSEMLLGPTPPGFKFVPKHKSNAYAESEMGVALEDQENG